MNILRVIIISTLISWTLTLSQETVPETKQLEENSKESIDTASVGISQKNSDVDTETASESSFITEVQTGSASPDTAGDTSGTDNQTDEVEQTESPFAAGDEKTAAELPETAPESLFVVEEQTDSAGSVATGDTSVTEIQTDEVEQIENPFLAGALDTVPESEEETKKSLFDIIVDISRGVSLTRFEVEPTTFKFAESKGGYDFLFDIGIMVPFGKWFFAELSFRFMKLKFELSYSYKTKGISSIQTNTIETEEVLSFISAPIDIGLRFDLGPVVPYLYGEITPAYLTGAHQHAVTENETLFPDSTTTTWRVMEDIDVTDQRECHQVFLGGGIGLEVYYGYGTIYIDGACQIAYFNPDEKNDNKSKPKRKAERLIYFPISLGLRFYL